MAMENTHTNTQRKHKLYKNASTVFKFFSVKLSVFHCGLFWEGKALHDCSFNFVFEYPETLMIICL